MAKYHYAMDEWYPIPMLKETGPTAWCSHWPVKELPYDLVNRYEEAKSNFDILRIEVLDFLEENE